jgi:hypothetical protein
MKSNPSHDLSRRGFLGAGVAATLAILFQRVRGRRESASRHLSI